MLYRKLKNKNQSWQQQKQAFTNQDKTDVLKYKKANLSTKKLVEFLAEKFKVSTHQIVGKTSRDCPSVDIVIAPWVSVRNMRHSLSLYFFKTDGCGNL